MPINPCGTAIDLVRSCYSTKMRFFQDSDLEVTVRWFFTEPGAKWLPYLTRFGSGNWASQREEWNGPGEVLGAPRPWSNGATPEDLHGQSFCGTQDQWENGCILGE